MSTLVVLPLLVLVASAALCIVAYRHPRLQRLISLAGMLALLGSGIALLVMVERDGIHAVQAANWPAPFGITIVADLFSSMMIVVAGIIGTVAVLYSFATVDIRREHFGHWPLVNVLVLGVCGAFLTGDLFNLYVWFEVMLIASFVLLVLGNERPQIEGAIKYVTLNLISSAMFLTGVGLLYGMTGTLNMADLARAVGEVENQGLVTTVAILFMVAFGIKAAAFPLFFWLPASYHTPPPAVSALFAGLLTKVGVYALIRVFTLIFVHDPDVTHNIILVGAGLTMVSGVLGAVAQHEMRRILSFHIVSQVGYMLVGLGLFTPLALAAAVFYVVHHIIVKTALFLVAGIVERLKGSYELKQLGGVYASNLVVAGLFAVPALSLAGIPPFSGFFAKLAIIRAGLEGESYVIVAAALVVGFLTVFSMAKIGFEVFWKPDPVQRFDPLPRAPWLMGFATLLLVAISIAIGLGAEPVFDLSQRAAEQLMAPDAYITAVLGGSEP